MLTDLLHLPLELVISKKYFQKQMLIYSSFAALCIILFLWECYDYLYKDYYYPQIIILAPIVFIVLIVLIIQEIIRYKLGKPEAILTKQGIQFHKKPLNAIGLIQWQDVINCQEMAVGLNGRKFAFFVKNNDAYINAINGWFKKRAVLKSVKRQGGALAILKANMLDVNAAGLKKLITDSITHQNK